MHVRTDHELIQRRFRIAQVTGLGGLVVLLAGLALSFSSQWFLYSYAALFAGVILASIGNYHANKWVAKPRADQALEDAMKGFDDRYRLYNYVLPAEHLLLTPYGLVVINVKRQEGEISYRDGEWDQGFSLRRFLQGLGRERLGDPIEQVHWEIDEMREVVDIGEFNGEVPLEGLVVFIHPKAVVEAADPPTPVVHVKQLKGQLRRAAQERGNLPAAQREALARTLDEIAE